MTSNNYFVINGSLKITTKLDGIGLPADRKNQCSRNKLPLHNKSGEGAGGVGRSRDVRDPAHFVPSLLLPSDRAILI